MDLHDIPRTEEELIALQEVLAAAQPPPWSPPRGPLVVGGCAVVFEKGGPVRPGAERGWAGAALVGGGTEPVVAAVAGTTAVPYEPGKMALREIALLVDAVRALPSRPDVLLVNGAGCDHPRRAGLALQLGAVLDLPTVGVTRTPLRAAAERPGDEAGATTRLVLDGEPVGWRFRARAGAWPVCVHLGWRTGPDAALDVVRRTTSRGSVPDPLRAARRAAMQARRDG